jgi:hypothetical protein
MISHSEIIKPTCEIEVEIRRARAKLQDAIWDENEELQEALRREIDRLELKRSLGETHEYLF